MLPSTMSHHAQDIYNTIPQTTLGLSTNTAMYTAGARYAILGQFGFYTRQVLLHCCNTLVECFWL